MIDDAASVGPFGGLSFRFCGFAPKGQTSTLVASVSQVLWLQQPRSSWAAEDFVHPWSLHSRRHECKIADAVFPSCCVRRLSESVSPSSNACSAYFAATCSSFLRFQQYELCRSLKPSFHSKNIPS